MLHTQQIVITRDNCDRLQAELSNHVTACISDTRCVQAIHGILSEARIVERNELPKNIVTMNSLVCLCDLKQRRIDSYRLVYPGDANIAEGRLSVLAPIGIAILGRQVNDEITLDVTSGPMRICVEAILEQPER